MNTEQAFKSDAERIVDILFDTKCFRADITREDMRHVEEYLRFSMESRYDLNKRVEKLLDKIPNPPEIIHN